jgi:hypothetical protein
MSGLDEQAVEAVGVRARKSREGGAFGGGKSAEGYRASGESGEFFDASLEQIVFGGGY